MKFILVTAIVCFSCILAESPPSSSILSSILLPPPATSTSLKSGQFAPTTGESHSRPLRAAEKIEKVDVEKQADITSTEAPKAKHEKIQAAGGKIGFVKTKLEKDD